MLTSDISQIMFFCHGLIYINSKNSLKKIQVITHNTGLAQFPILPITIVPYNKFRLVEQLNEMEKILAKPFIFILQEVFRSSYSVYKSWAIKHKYSFTKTKVTPQDRVTKISPICAIILLFTFLSQKNCGHAKS